MSDIDLTRGLAPLIYGAEALFVAGLVLWAVGTFGGSRVRFRKLWQILGAVIAVPLGLAFLSLVVAMSHSGDDLLREDDRTLRGPETIQGYTFPAHTLVRTRSKTGELIGARLPAPTVIDGIAVEGWVSFFHAYGQPATRMTGGVLHSSTEIYGVPCRGGEPFELDVERPVLHKCILSKTYRQFDVDWPAGTEFWRLPDSNLSMSLKASEADVEIQGIRVPRPWSICFTRGRLSELSAQPGSPPVVLDGVALIDFVYLKEDGSIEGKVARDCRIQGQEYKAEEIARWTPHHPTQLQR